MAVTLKEIAEAAGVSRGTVDRALNNRGRIKPEVAAKIKKIAEEKGYIPNMAGRALAKTKQAIKIGVIARSADTPFMLEVLKGAYDAKEEVERLGATVVIKKINGTNAGEVISALEELKEQNFSGIALAPINDELLKKTMNQLTDEHGIHIVTFNSDIGGTSRSCYVGQDAIRSGKTAAGLMGELIGESGKVAIISGHSTNQSHSNRAQGFQMEMESRYQQVELLDVRYSYEDNWVSEKIMDELIEEYPDIAGVYVTSHGEDGICRALERKKMNGKVKVIANDFAGENKKNLQKGTINFLIGQDAYVQGYDPIMILFDKLFYGKEPAKEFNYTEIVIKTRNNI